MKNKRKSTCEKMQTKDWSTMTVRLPKSVKEHLRTDAKENVRPIGMHLSYIIINHFKQKESK